MPEYDLTHNKYVVHSMIIQTFNSFFARRLLASARPIDAQMDNKVITSPADCRLTVFKVRAVDDYLGGLPKLDGRSGKVADPIGVLYGMRL